MWYYRLTEPLFVDTIRLPTVVEAENLETSLRPFNLLKVVSIGFDIWVSFVFRNASPVSWVRDNRWQSGPSFGSYSA